MGTGARDHLEGFDPSCGRLDDVAVPEVLKVLAESVEKGLGRLMGGGGERRENIDA